MHQDCRKCGKMERKINAFWSKKCSKFMLIFSTRHIFHDILEDFHKYIYSRYSVPFKGRGTQVSVFPVTGRFLKTTKKPTSQDGSASPQPGSPTGEGWSRICRSRLPTASVPAPTQARAPCLRARLSHLLSPRTSRVSASRP